MIEKFFMVYLLKEIAIKKFLTMSEKEPAQTLHQQGYRVTPQRLAILNVIEESDGHLSAMEVYERTRKILPGVTEATIYRNLDFLVNQGLILMAHVGSGKVVYESTRRLHHHLICRKCGASQEIPHTLLTNLFEELSRVSGYQVDTFHVTFFGICSNCQSQ